MESHQDQISINRLRDLSDRVVIVTGAGQGIGRHFAKGLAAAGAVPVIIDIDLLKGQSVVKEIEAVGGRALAIKGDVSDPASVEKMVETVIDSFGRIDGLVNNAAIFSTLKMRPFEEIPLEEWCKVLDVNVTGLMLCCKAVIPHMKAAKAGRIINISSASITMGRPNYLHYTTSKAAVIGLTRSMAREVGPFDITVNAILPGPTFTEIPRETVSAAQKEAFITMQCIKRHQTPNDLLGVVLFLMSESASFLTGQGITIDGGATHP